MDITDFKNVWLGKRVVDTSLRTTDLKPEQWYQCVSLIKEYLRSQFNLFPGAWGNAIDYWTKPAQPLYDYFERLETNDTKQGDIVILTGLVGNPYGHIGIATGNQTATTAEILEQNGSTGGGTGLAGDAIRVRFVNRYRIAGVLRPKVNGGVDMIGKNSTELLRIAHSEIGGWDLNKTHAGEYDGLFHAAWDGKDVNQFIYTQWVNGADYRAAKQAAFDAAAKLSQTPSTENFNALQKALEVCQVSEKKLLEKQASLEAQSQADQATGESVFRSIGRWFREWRI